MKRISLNRTILTGSLFIALISSSCLKNDFEDEENAEKEKIKTYLDTHGFTEANNIGSGVYLKFANDTSATTGKKPTYGKTIIVNFSGKYTDGKLFDCTDSIAGTKEFPTSYLVYGPGRLRIGSLIQGMEMAIKHFSIGDSGTIVIPSAMAYFDFEPVVYTIKLIDIIDDDAVYEKNMLGNYLVNNQFFADSALFDSVFYKGHPVLNDTIKKGDSIAVKVLARFAEDYYGSHIGRVFYPLNTTKEEIKWKYGNTNFIFPVTPAIEKALTYMAIGDTLEIACPSKYAYGKTGFNNPYLYVPIVPAYMPVHYRLILTDIKPNK